RAGGLDHVPVEQREHLVEAGAAGKVGVVEVREAAVAEADIGRNQCETGLVVGGYATAVAVEERACGDVRLPLVNRDLVHVCYGRGESARHADRRRNAVHDLVVPLVEDRDLKVARWNIRENEIPVGIALGEGEVESVGLAQAREAL